MSLAALFALSVPSTSFSNPAFTAVCNDAVTHGYRDGTNLFGQPMKTSWSTTEKFNLEWSFIYRGGRTIDIDGKQGCVLVQHPGDLIVSEVPGTNGFASGVWVYAIHLGMKTVVGAQVNGHGHASGPLQGVKGRTTQMRCDFNYPTQIVP